MAIQIIKLIWQKQIFSVQGKEKLFNDYELRGFIDSLDFKVNNKPVQWDLLPGQPDICKVLLNTLLGPGDTIVITTPFHVKIPKGVTSRLGHIGESYQISQWYPKPAVYDKSGWHQMPYLDQGEFYSEFGSFDVSITLPENYSVGATGDLQTEKEKERLNSLAADQPWLNSVGDETDFFPPSSTHFKTLRFTGNEIHDFAWFADKRFHIIKGSVQLPESGKTVSTMVMFTNQQKNLWKDALEYVNNSILYFSDLIGDYPYNSFTAVQSALTAGAGMEYPGITVIGYAEDAYSLDEVIAHEACHNWFYSALGSNERRYPYMDESITSFYEKRYTNEKYPGRKLWESYFSNFKLVKFLHIREMPAQRITEIEWLMQARQNLEQPLNLAAPDYSYTNYGTIVYSKAAMGFNYLRAYLGDSLFDLTMHDFFSTWKSKHPGTNDLRNIFEASSGKDLSWFFSDFIGTTKRLDYKAVRTEKEKLLVKNKGELISPLIITGLQGDSIVFEKWEEGFSGKKWIGLNLKYSELKIDNSHLMPELFRLNNNIRAEGIFRKTDPVRLQLLYTIEDPDKRTLLYMPAINWTRENGFMAGVALNNGFLIPKRVEYFIMPFYSFKDPQLAGYGIVTFNITPYNKIVRLASMTLEGSQYGAPGNQNYHMAKAGIDLWLRTAEMNNPHSQKIFGYYFAASDLSLIELQQKSQMTSFTQVGYKMENNRTINPYSLKSTLESNKSYQKASFEINYRQSYYGKNSGLDIRMFAGMMLSDRSSVPFYSFSPGGRGGREQYLYQGTYPDRFSVFPKSFWSRQMDLSEGGLVTPVNDSLGFSRLLISLSLTSSLPDIARQMPLKPFVNILLNNQGLQSGKISPIYWEAGFKTGIWNFFEIYIPLIVSDNIQSIAGTFKDRIRLVLKLESFNKLKLIN